MQETRLLDAAVSSALTETDVDARRGSLLVRHGKGDKRREVGSDEWGFHHLNIWIEQRLHLPVGPLFLALLTFPWVQ